MKKFRLLRADEIDCRVAMVKNSGLSLLLYKDARCDMNILDEEVGQENWQRSHSRDNANCTVSIWDGNVCRLSLEDFRLSITAEHFIMYLFIGGMENTCQLCTKHPVIRICIQASTPPESLDFKA